MFCLAGIKVQVLTVHEKLQGQLRLGVTCHFYKRLFPVLLILLSLALPVSVYKKHICSNTWLKTEKLKCYMLQAITRLLKS